MLTNFDICFLGWKKERLYNFGTSANKIFDYMYSGKVILNSIDSKNNVVELAKCGLVVESENSKAIADWIIKLYNMTEIERKQLGEQGRK